MFTERDLVERNVLWNQNELIDELVKSRAVDEDTFLSAIGEEEVLEWWLVLPTFAKYLKAENEVILEIFGSHYWGRTTSGMAIYMDSVITDIVNKLNSLTTWIV